MGTSFLDARHDAKYVVIYGVHAYLSRVGTLNRGIGQHQLKGGVINAREVAGARWLVLFRAEGEGVDVDTLIRVSGVVLVRLDEGEVRTFTFRETVLAVKLELSGDDGVLTPAVHIEGRFSEDESSGIGDTRGVVGGERLSAPAGTSGDVHGSGIPEETRGRDEVSTIDLVLATERHDGVRESVNTIGVVEGLSTERSEEGGSAGQRRAVVNIGIRLNNEDQLFAGVVEVQLNLVARATDGLITSELKLFNEVFVGVLGHTATLIRVQEDVVNVEGSSDEGLVVGGSHAYAGVRNSVGNVSDGPQALINRTNIQVNLDFVVLKGNEREGQTRVAAVPELEGNIEGCFRESIAGLAHLGGSSGRARTINSRERGIGDEGQLCGVADHLKVTALLFLGKGELVPQVHPVTILAINTLTTDFDFNLGNHLLPREIEPAGPDTRRGARRVNHRLIDFRQSHLQIGAVSQITVTADRASHTSPKIGLTVKGLFNRFH